MLQAGDHIVVVRPNYATNLETPRAIGCELSLIDVTFEDGFRLDLAKIEAAIRPDTKYLSVTYPHNPTGVMISPAELDALVALVERKGIYLLFDETYREMTFGPMLPVAASLSDRVISVSSLSKNLRHSRHPHRLADHPRCHADGHLPRRARTDRHFRQHGGRVHRLCRTQPARGMAPLQQCPHRQRLCHRQGLDRRRAAGRMGRSRPVAASAFRVSCRLRMSTSPPSTIGSIASTTPMSVVAAGSNRTTGISASVMPGQPRTSCVGAWPRSPPRSARA